MARIYLSVGSNLGNRFENVTAAKRLVDGHPDLKVLRCSPYYETEAAEVSEPQGKFLNGVWEMDCQLEPAALLKFLQSVESELGRERPYENAPRLIDLDILFYDNQTVDEEGLNIPHPRLQDRYFVLKPLCDLNPNIKHYKLDKYSSQLLKACVERKVESPATPS